MQNNEPKVSIITPCYNGEKYLTHFFDSLVGQKYNNVEFIFVDDGSTDSTADIYKKYEIKLKEKGWECKYIYKNNGGAASAINSALPLISGKYLIWTDSDDILYPNHIDEKVRYMEEHPEYAIVYCFLDVVKYDNLEEVLYIDKRALNCNKAFYNILFERPITWPPVGVIVRTDALFDVIPEKKIPVCSGGQNCQIQMPVLYKYSCGFINKSLGKYVQREDSHSHVHKRKFLHRRLQMLKIWMLTISSLKYAGKQEKRDLLLTVLLRNIFMILEHYLSRIFSLKKNDNHFILNILFIKLSFKLCRNSQTLTAVEKERE